MRVSLIAAALALLVGIPAVAGAAPTCEEGPQTVGNTITGTPCDDTIRLSPGVNTAFGEGGDDVIFGGRGNARIDGGPGDDKLYGGVGDDQLRGGSGEDLLSGGFGADSLDGEADGDLIRGDATIDAIVDSGSSGVDTLSFATGVTPGFPNQGDFFDYTDFPSTAEGRGVYVDLTQGFAHNGLAPAGGGVDLDLDGTSFERVIGTPFPDLIVGTANVEEIYGGGGADVILGGGGADQIVGGAEGDSCQAAPEATVDCETDQQEVYPRDPGAIAVGLMTPPGIGPPALYLTGSDEDDDVTVSYAEGEVSFALGPGSVGAFDAGQAMDGGCDPPVDDSVVCPIGEAPDSIVLAGLDGDDALSAPGLPEATSVVLLGNLDDDELSGGATEDTLVDGSGDDSVSGGGGDDALPNNEGEDDLDAGEGNDLFISDSVCEGDAIDGGPGRDNANWAKFDTAISIDMEDRIAGFVGSGGEPDCGTGSLSTLTGIEAIEGTSYDDTLIGDDGPNGLLGRQGADSYFAGAGDDAILANSGTPDPDPDPTIDCGGGEGDFALIDHPENGPDSEPVDCEAVAERDPNSFRPPDIPTGPEPPPESEPPEAEQASESAQRPVPRPRTRLLHRPRRVVFTKRRWRRVAFRFAAEPGARYFCRLDHRRFRPCRSPHVYAVRPGRHAFRVFAFTRHGGRDRSPARALFRVRRVSGRWIRIHRRRARNRSAQRPRSAPQSRRVRSPAGRSGLPARP